MHREPVRNYQKAVEDFRQALKIHENTKYRLMLGKAILKSGLVEYENGNIEEAIQRWQQSSENLQPLAESDDNNSEEAQQLLAEVKLAVNAANHAQGIRVQDLRERTKQILQQDNRLGDLDWLKEKLWWGDRLLADARNLFAELNPTPPDNDYYQMGNSFTQLGQYDMAIECYQKATEMNPDYAVAYCKMGNAYYEKGDVRESLEKWQKSGEIAQQYAQSGIEGTGSLLAEIQLALAVASLAHSNPEPHHIRQAVENAIKLDNRVNNLNFLKENLGWGNRLLADTRKLVKFYKDDNDDNNYLQQARALLKQGLREYEMGGVNEALEKWQQSRRIFQQLAQSGSGEAAKLLAETQLAINVALFAHGRREQEVIEAAVMALKLDNNLFDGGFLKDNCGWGDRLAGEAQEFFALLMLNHLFNN